MGYGAILGKSSTTWTNDQIMSNTTAALFGLGTDAVPDDMLNALAHTGDLHVWKRTQSGVVDYPVSPNPDAYQEGSDAQPAGYTLGEVQSGQFKLTTDSDLYSPSILYSYGSSVYVSEDGSLSLLSPDGSVSATREQYEYDRLPVLKGKFIQANTPGSGNWIGDFQVGEIFFIPETATLNKLSNGTPFFSQIQAVTGYAAIPANTTIEYLGQVGSFGERAQIVTGSYVGTGKYGSENPNSLTFEFAPKVLFIIASVGVSSSAGEHMWKAEFYLNGVFSSYKSNGYFLRNGTSLLSSDSLFSMINSVGKKVLWYGSNARTQLNSTGETYYYTAIG